MIERATSLRNQASAFPRDWGPPPSGDQHEVSSWILAKLGRRDAERELIEWAGINGPTAALRYLRQKAPSLDGAEALKRLEARRR